MPPRPQYPVVDGQKRCKTCKKVLPASAFYGRRNGILDPNCKECCKEYSRRWYAAHAQRMYKVNRAWKEANPERHSFLMWRSHIRRKYNLTPEDYDRLIGDRPKCGICGTQDFGGRRPDIDHDHATKKVRGTLCTRCNGALERIEAIPDWVEKARGYLNRHDPSSTGDTRDAAMGG